MPEQRTPDPLPPLELPRQDGRTVAITGTTSGTGRVLARTAAALGARLILLNRASERAERSAAELRASGAEVIPIDLDLQSFASVRAGAAALAEACPEGLDVLAENAGVMALPDTATVDGCDVQMQTNHLSHFLLTALAWPLLLRAAERGGDARVVTHSSGARRGPALRPEYLQPRGGDLGGDGFPGSGKWRRYQQSKLANLLFVYALDERMPASARDAGVKALGAHPGPTDSGLQGKTSAAGGTRMLDRMILNRTLRVAAPVEDGAQGIQRACFDAEAPSGGFYGPAGRGLPGPAVLLPAERDPESEALLWRESLATTGIGDFFSAR